MVVKTKHFSRYANLLAGAVRGALEMVHLEVACWFVQDTLKGDNVTEMRVKFIRKIEDSIPPGDDWSFMNVIIFHTIE